MTGPPRVAGVVLAAGASSRLGRPKQLLDLGGRPLVAHAVATAVDAGLEEVIVVVGNAADAVEAALAGTPARIVRNPRFAEGQSTSVVAGIAALGPGTEGVVFLLGDQPGVSPATVRALADAFALTRAPIVAPVYGGTMGNPVLLSRDLFPELLHLTGDEGARPLVKARIAEVLKVPVAGASPPPDIDTEDDYQRLLAGWPAS